MVVASSTSTCSPQTQPLLKSDENEGAHSLQCPVSETVDSPRIIIADWADGRGKGGDEVFHSEFTQRSMVRYPQTTQHSSAALTDSLNFWSGWSRYNQSTFVQFDFSFVLSDNSVNNRM